VLQVTPASVLFGTIGVGQTSKATSVTVTNPGTRTALNNLALAIPAGFQLVNNTCTATLAAASSCTAGVEFAPAGAGAQSGNLIVTSSSASTAVQVALTGMGFDYTVAGTGSIAQTVSSGQTADFVLAICGVAGCSSVTPGLVANGAFAFQCGTLPANALCLFSPASESLNAGISGDVTVEISTGLPGPAARSTMPALGRVVPLACALVLLPFGWKRRRRMLLLVVLLAAVAGGVSSCTSSGGGGGSGGGTGGGTGSGATPAGTYNIPVTVSSTGVQHIVNVTLTVD
jgi:hypothetical protein